MRDSAVALIASWQGLSRWWINVLFLLPKRAKNVKH
jgi:hypothetical protein